MVSLLTLAGGVSLTSAFVYQRTKRKETASAYWEKPWQTIRKALTHARQQLSPSEVLRHPKGMSLVQQLASDASSNHYELHTSALALGVSAVGSLLFPPLRIAGMPLLVFMGLPAAQAAYTQLQLDGRPSRALAETVALVVCLTSGYYTFTALGFCLYHGARYQLAQQQHTSTEETRPLLSWVSPPTIHLLCEGATQSVATATLQPGDHVLLQSGEIAPIRGLIIEGAAWLYPQALSTTTTALHKSAGDLIDIQDMVVVGRICVRVLPHP